MRDIKFKVFCDKHSREEVYTLGDLITGSAGSYNGEGGIFENWRQFTGLKDKNGKEIYEGDVIKNNWNNVYGKDISSIWEVKFGEYDNSDIEYGSSGNIGFYACDIRTKEMEGLNNLPCNNNDGIEVIGNIYENPELLED